MNLCPRDDDNEDNPGGYQRKKLCKQIVIPQYMVNRENEEKREIVMESDDYGEWERRDYFIVTWISWLEKYFFPQGSEVWVRKGNQWVAGSVERLAQPDPAVHQGRDSNDAQEIDNEFVSVLVKFDSNNGEEESFVWSSVFPRSPALMTKRNVMSPECLNVMNLVVDRQTMVMTDEEKALIGRRYRIWLEVNATKPFYHDHWTDKMVAILLKITFDNGDPFGLEDVDMRYNNRVFGSYMTLVNDVLPNYAVNSDWEDNVEEHLRADELDRELDELDQLITGQD